MSDKLKSELAVTLELTGTKLSDIGIEAILAELSAYPEAGVVEALKRCRRECKYRMSLADVIERMPGRQLEAWKMSDDALVDRAKEIGISTVGKSRDQLVRDIDWHAGQSIHERLSNG